MTTTPNGIGSKMAKGAAWMVLFKLAQRVIGVASTLILARLLVPADFGLIAMAMSVFAILEILSSFSFDLALIQNRKAERRHYDTVWTFNVVFALTNAMLMLLMGAPVAVFFSEPKVEWIMYSLALCSVISGFENIGIIAFQKDLELHKEFYFGITKKLTSFIVTVAVAYWWRNYWALVLGMVTGRLVGVIMSYWVHSYRPKFSIAATSELFHFSKWMLINNILIFINNSGINSIIGKIFGPDALGTYSVAYEISNLPTTEIVWPISRAVFPGYASVAGDRKALRELFLQVISLICLITIPAGIGIAVVAEPLVLVLLGEKWIGAIVLVKVLALYGVVRTLYGPPGSIYLALDKPQLIAYLQIFHIAIAALFIYWLSGDYGLLGISLAILAASTVSLPTNYIWLMRELELSFSQILNVVWRPIVAAALMFFSVSYCARVWPVVEGTGQSILRLTVMVMLGAVTYIATVVVLWQLSRFPDGGERKVLDLIRNRFFRKS